MVYSYIAHQADLLKNQIKILRTIERETLPAIVGGSYFAIANDCKHGGGLLANGSLDTTCIRCPAMGPCSICGPASRLRGSQSRVE